MVIDSHETSLAGIRKKIMSIVTDGLLKSAPGKCRRKNKGGNGTEQ